MTAGNFDRSLVPLLKHEGGYVDHPRDPGGATNMGITIGTLRAWRGKPVTKMDVMNLSKSEASAIYRKQYWDAVRGDDLPSGLDYAVFDYTVNSGAGRAVRDLQRVLGVTVDGQMGAITLDAIRKRNTRELITLYMDRRLSFLRNLRTWSTFGRGWQRRVDEVRTLALRMASGTPDARPVVNPTATLSQGKARASDTKATSTPEGRGAIATGIGTAGQIIAEQAKQLEPVAAFAPALQWLFIALTVAGVGFAVWALLKRIKEGQAS
jgi:lysozyme family protein